jgi:hypothetical protein
MVRLPISANFSIETHKPWLQIESEGITENVKELRTDIISALTSALPVDKLMFEAADPAVFAYVICPLALPLLEHIPVYCSGTTSKRLVQT